MSINDPAAFLEQLAAEVADLSDRLDAAGVATLEALLTAPSGEPRLGVSSVPSGTSGAGDVTQTAVLAPGSVVSDSIASGAVTMPKIAANAVDVTKFAQAIIPPRVVTSLPTLPDTNFPTGSIVFYTVDETLYKNVAGTWTATTEADLVANTLYAGAITAGAIGARELATVILLASLIKTSDTGARVEIDKDGVRLIASDNTLLVNIPTDGSDVYIRAEVRALGLTVYQDAELRGTANVLAAGSSTSLKVGISDPSVKPTLAQDWATFSTEMEYNARGLAFSASGTATGTVDVFYQITNDGLDFTLNEYLASDGSLNRTKNLSTEFPGTPVQGCAAHGSYVYVIDWDGYVARYTITTLAVDATYGSVSLPVAGGNYPRICSDGTYLFIVDHSSTGEVKFAKYNDSMVLQGSVVSTGYDFGTPPDPIVGDCEAGQFDFGADRIAVALNGSGGEAGTVHLFTYAGAHQTTECFPLPAATFGTAIAWGSVNGAADQFVSKNSNSPNLTLHTAWTWTTSASYYYVAYSWYDSDSGGTGTHETLVGPLQWITMGKRKRLQVTTPTEPGAGGTDDPNGRRIYIYPTPGSAPATTLLDLQATTADESYYITTYDSGGAAPPTSNNFPASTAAEIKSAGAEWVLKGSGLINLTGTAFPSGAVTGDQFYRSDLGAWFFYNGTRWLSTTLYVTQTDMPTLITADSTLLQTPPIIPTGYSDAWLEDWQLYLWVASGTPSGTNKWVVTLYKRVAANASPGTSVASYSYDSGSTGVWRSTTVAIDALLNNGTTHYTFTTLADVSGTIGGFQMIGGLTYRLVAT